MERVSILPAVWNVPELFRKRLGRNVGRQRAMTADGHLLLVLHAPPGPEDVERVGRFFWKQPDGTWSSNCFGGGPSSLAQHLDEFQKAIEKLEQNDQSAQSAEDYFDVLDRLEPLQRASRNLHQALQSAREQCDNDPDVINFRDRAYQIERTADLLSRDARNSMELHIARRADEQSANSFQMSVAAHRLNVLAAFFFPIITLSTIFGTNLKSGLEETPGPLPLLCLLLAGLFLGFLLRGIVTTPANRRPAKGGAARSEREKGGGGKSGG